MSQTLNHLKDCQKQFVAVGVVVQDLAAVAEDREEEECFLLQSLDKAEVVAVAVLVCWGQSYHQRCYSFHCQSQQEQRPNQDPQILKC